MTIRTFGAPVVFAAAVVSMAIVIADERSPSQQLQEAVTLMEVRHDYRAAIPIFETVSKAPDRALAARALLYLGRCYERLGRGEAQRAYERILRDFSDQTEAVSEARLLLSRLRGTAAGRPLITVRKSALQPTFSIDSRPSLDGRYFSDIDPASGSLLLIDATSGQRRQLARGVPKGDEASYMSAISPDGRRVAYGWWTRDERYDVRLIGSRGGAARVLMSLARGEGPERMVWSRDGARLVVAVRRADASVDLVLVSPADGGTRMLKSFDSAAPLRFDVSPDGHFLAYDGPGSSGPAETDLFVMRTDTGEERRIVRHPSSDRDPLWTPDGGAVVFISDRTGTTGVWMQRVVNGVAQGTPELLYRDLGRAILGGITASGVLYYTLQTGLVDVYTVDFDAASLQVRGAPAQISPGAIGSNNTCAWSPDGESLVYIESLAWSTRQNSRLTVGNLRTGTVRRISPAMYGFLLPRWSPDGQSVLVKGYDSRQRYGIYRIDLDTGAATAIATTPASDESDLGAYQWTPDGRAVLFGHSKRGLVSHDLATGTETRVFDPAPLQMGRFGYAPGHDRLAFSGWVRDGTRMARVLVVKDGDAPPRELLRVHQPDMLEFWTWTPDAAGLLYTKVTVTSGGDNSELYYVPASGGVPRTVGLSARGLRSVTLTPDGRRLAYTAGWPEWQLWTMENFLPVRQTTPAAPSTRRGAR